ncbi:hypothetical protein J7L36_01775, partial [bacterium]|nr:hypothetical protein [bacterium]
LLPIIKRIPNKIVRSFWIQKLAKKLGVREEDVREELKKVKLEEESFSSETEEIVQLPQKSRKELLEERLVTVGLRDPDFFDLISEKDYEFFSPKISQILTFLKAKKGIPENLSEFFNYLALKSEIEPAEAKDEAEKDFKDCLNEIRKLGIKEKLNEISQEIKKAEEEKNQQKIRDLIEKFNYWTKKIQAIP